LVLNAVKPDFQRVLVFRSFEVSGVGLIAGGEEGSIGGA
jgi:hypothetical protein